MEDKIISVYSHEEDMARMERSNFRAWALCIILIIALIGTNAGWVYYESQFQELTDTTTITQELDSDNGSAVINDGVHFNEK